MNKTDKAIMFGFIYIPIIIIIGYSLWTLKFDESVYDAIKREDLNEEFHGKVDSLFREERNHNAKVALMSGGYKFGINSSWENKILVGDSLSKSKGSTLLRVYRNGREFTLDYKDTYTNNK